MEQKRFNISVVIEHDSDGYFAFSPELQGCYAQGKSHEEALANIRDAIRLHLEDRIAEREEIPHAQSVTLSTVEVTV
jgi:predicted RNase H-like HicB family nuclease